MVDPELTETRTIYRKPVVALQIRHQMTFESARVGRYISYLLWSKHDRLENENNM